MSTTGKMSARERINLLLDDNSFVEIGAGVKARATDFNIQSVETPADGVVTGFGLISGRLVYVYSQDASVLGGSIGEMHAKKILNMYKKAMQMQAPVIGLVESSGVRLQESTDALNSLARIYQAMAKASGVVPQYTGVFGNCGGGLAVLASMSDFTVADNDAKVFVNTPNAFAGNYTEKCDTAKVSYQAENTDNIDYADDEEGVITYLRNLVDILPSSNEEEMYGECTDDLNRSVAGVDSVAADSAQALAMISDNGFVCELKKDYAPEMVTAFIKLNGATVGVVANCTKKFDEDGKEVASYEAKLTAKGCVKAADFINFCDAFSVPVLTLTNAEGYVATTVDEEKIAKASAKLAFAFASATVPKVNLITNKAYGSAYAIMNSRGLGADMVYAWPNAVIGCMDANSAAKIIAGEGEDVAEVAAKFGQVQQSVESAAARGLVDTIIEPEDTRKYLVGAFEMLYSKAEYNSDRKHGTI